MRRSEEENEDRLIYSTRCRQKLLQRVVLQLANSSQRYIRFGKLRYQRRVQRVVSLPRKNRRHAILPVLFDRRQYPYFIVYYYVVSGGIFFLHIGKLFVFVHINEHAAFKVLIQAGAIYFPRLEDDVAIAQYHRQPQLARMLHRIQRFRIEPVLSLIHI